MEIKLTSILFPIQHVGVPTMNKKIEVSCHRQKSFLAKIYFGLQNVVLINSAFQLLRSIAAIRNKPDFSGFYSINMLSVNILIYISLYQINSFLSRKKVRI